MRAREVIPDFDKLTAAERIQLAEELWDSLDPAGKEPPLTPAQAAELDRRLEDYRRFPDAGEPWEVVRERLHSRLHKRE